MQVLELFERMFAQHIRGLFPTQEFQSNRGRKSFDPVFMMRVLLIQRRFGLSDNEMEEALRFDMLYQFIAGLKSPNEKNIPKAKTIWKYRNIFDKHNFFKTCFEDFTDYARGTFLDLCTSEAVLIDSSF